MKIKTILIIGLLLAFSSAASGITLEKTKFPVRKGSVRSSKKTQEKRMLLLNWQGDYLRTTKGTIYVADVNINNATGLTREELNHSPQAFMVRVVGYGTNAARVDIVKAGK